MENVRLTVFFEEPFWVGIFEIIDNGKLSAARVVFGAEPKDGEVYAFVLRNFYKLKFSPAVEVTEKEPKKNPKRIQRQVRNQLQNNGTGTKSQQALKLQYEQSKAERKIISKEKRLAEEKRLFELKQQKKKEKHRGR